MDYLVAVGTMIAIYAIAAIGLNLAFGLAGIFIVTQGAFIGIGAYVVGIASKGMPFGFAVGLVLAVVIAMALSWLIAFLTIRIPGEAFIVSSIGVQIVIVDVMHNWKSVTGGSNGLANVPDVVPPGIPFLLLSVAFLALAAIYARRISRSPVGRALRAIRDDEVASAAAGKDVLGLRIHVYMVSSAMAAISGGLLAVYSHYLHPASFTLVQSILVIAMIVAGGVGSTRGALLGAFLVLGLPELLRFLPVMSKYVMQVQQLIYGAVLLLIPFVRPRGLLPDDVSTRSAGRTDRNKPEIAKIEEEVTHAAR